MTHQFPSIPVIYEDDDLLVINKPPGIVVNRSHTQKQLTIQDWIEERSQNFALQTHSASGKTSKINTQPHSDDSFGTEKMAKNKNSQLNESNGLQTQNSPHLEEDSKGRGSENSLQNDDGIILGDPLELFRERSGIVHRLDKDTSGVMLIAKNPESLIGCMTQFKLRQTQKTYTALVHGKLQPQHGEINLPIGRNPKKRLQYAVVEDGKASITEYRVIEYFPHVDLEKVIKLTDHSERKSLEFYAKNVHGLPRNLRHAIKIYQGFSYLELSPKSGRTHQLRVHLAHIKHPIVADEIYSNNKKRLIDEFWCPRIFLHAKSLKIVHPRTKSELNFEAPLATDLTQALSFLTD